MGATNCSISSGLNTTSVPCAARRTGHGSGTKHDKEPDQRLFETDVHVIPPNHRDRKFVQRVRTTIDETIISH